MAARIDTVYNFSESCRGCGALLNPIENMYSYGQPLCPECRNNRQQELLKNRMSG